MPVPVNYTPEIYTVAVKRIILGWLQDFFSKRADYTYKPGDERDTNISIKDKHAFNMSSVLDKPALVLDRKQLRWERTSINKNAGYFGLRAAQGFMDLLTTSVVVHCMSTEGLVAETLAHIVGFGVESFKSEIRKLGIWDVTSVAIGEESIIVSKAGPEISSVPVILNVFIQGTWLRRRASTQLVEGVNVTQDT